MGPLQSRIRETEKNFNVSEKLPPFSVPRLINYEVWLLNNRTDAAPARCERVATSLNRTVSGDTFPTLSSLDKPVGRSV
ncbi:hypothetical protein NQ318_001459 [Aromia moschata]|uniref:Uncharacterized protein n=1 Tax=Aromia moschata TaxID=1265417 RepID=A0AAV8YXX9_9CUCU|nr:hypothetical protein NQ318_001459 [Aromia moschata]